MNPYGDSRRLWWENTEVYWELPFWAEINCNCEAQFDPEEAPYAREQLWAIREGHSDYPTVVSFADSRVPFPGPISVLDPIA